MEETHIKAEIERLKATLTGNLFEDGETQQQIYELKKQLNPQIVEHPELDAANVINRIVATARDAGTPGSDPIYGYGLVDAAAAVGASVPTVTANPMGELSEWITLYRRADSTPAPLPSGVPYAVPEPIELAPNSPLGTLLPTVNQLRVGGIPLLVFGAFAAIGGILIALALRHFRSLRKTE